MTSDFLNPFFNIDFKFRNLPHWNQSEVYYFVTFHLADSIPKVKIDEILRERELWLKNSKVSFTNKDMQAYNTLFSEKIEVLLNSGYGSCCLSNENLAKIVGDSLKFFHLNRYLLDEWVVMPNHVHVIVKPLGENQLSKILHSWKSFSAKEINRKLNREGQFWTHESFDHIIRNETSLNSIREYIRDNPKNGRVNVSQASWL